MTYEQWVEEVEKELGDAPISDIAQTWIFREAYYDGYSVKNACDKAVGQSEEDQ